MRSPRCTSRGHAPRHGGGGHVRGDCVQLSPRRPASFRPMRKRRSGGTTSTPQRVRGKAAPQCGLFRCSAPVRVRHSERLTTRKIRSSFAASSGASSTVDFCGWSGVSLTGPGEFLAWPASSRTEPERGEKTVRRWRPASVSKVFSPEVSHAPAGMTCISPQGEKSNRDRLT